MATQEHAHSFDGTTYADARTSGVATEPHRLLGEIWIVYGLLHFVAAALLVVYSAIATVMFGTLLNRVPDPFTLMGIFHFVYWVVIALAIMLGALGVFAGAALIRGREPARGLIVAAAVLALADVPFGTWLGGYTLLLSIRSEALILAHRP